MFTIKLICDRQEHIKEATVVTYYPSNNERNAHIMVWWKDEEPEDIYGVCTLYVMNENGKTVADYHINQEPNR